MPDVTNADDDGAHLQMVSTVIPLGGDAARLDLVRRGDVLEVEIAGPALAEPGPADTALIDDALRELSLLAAQPIGDGATIRLAAEHPPTDLATLPEAVADRAGYAHHRDLLQLRRPLPVAADHPLRAGPSLPTRAFEPGAEGHRDDAAAWVRVNNRSFAEHPDQGRETLDTLRDHQSEDWFSAAGFLVADDPTRPGELAGFCWTKVQPATGSEPALGEIYVIGVDPSHRGEGLGAAFVLAGLDHLASRGITTAVLYVDADNEPAVRLYERLGFGVHARRRVYSR